MDYKLPKQDINTEPFMRQPPPYNHKDVLMRTDKVYKCEMTNIVELTDTEKLFDSQLQMVMDEALSSEDHGRYRTAAL